MGASRLILGSRSPWRLALLEQLRLGAPIEVVPPKSSDEADFAGCHYWPAIEARLLEIAAAKFADVCAQVASQSRSAGEGRPVIIAADTVIIVEVADQLRVLGRPPEDESWRDVVRHWFEHFYAGKAHRVSTAMFVGEVGSVSPASRVVTSTVTFRGDAARWIDWYLDTGEPQGKAGGYAIQGAGSLFLSKLEGSLSNVVGLPTLELLELLEPWHLPLAGAI